MSIDIVIYTEASHDKGMGHIFRTIQLARSLASSGLICHILCNEFPPALQLLERERLSYSLVPAEAKKWEDEILDIIKPKLWINDRLETSVENAKRVTRRTRFMVIDDVSIGASLADLRILSMPCMFNKKHLHAKDLAGIEYLILNPQFKNNFRIRNNVATPKILVSAGGSDTWGVTCYIVNQLVKIPYRLPVTIITGPAFLDEPALQNLLQLQGGSHISWLGTVDNLSEQFALHDLLICAGGLTPFEAAANGLPSIILAAEDHEYENAIYVHQHNFGLVMGARAKGELSGNISDCLNKMTGGTITEFSKNAARHVDGLGLERVSRAIIEILYG